MMIPEFIHELSPVQGAIAMVLFAVALFAYRIYSIQKKGKDLGRNDVIAIMPWDILKHAFQQIRHAKFTVSGGGQSILVKRNGISKFEFERFLIENHFAPWNKLSYVYEGEDFNMRRLISLDRKDGEKIYYQLHVRVFFDEETIKIKPHVEKCPIEHPVDHIRQHGFDDIDGVTHMTKILEDGEFEIIEE